MIASLLLVMVPPNGALVTDAYASAMDDDQSWRPGQRQHADFRCDIRSRRSSFDARSAD